MQDQEIRLTPDMMKALGENTKARILRELSHGPRTPTDIGRKLNKSTPTIVEHLEKLVNSGLVEKREQPGKKYVFYNLTETSKELVFNKSKVSVVLYGSITLFVVGALLLGTETYMGLGQFSATALVANSASPAVVATASPNTFLVLYIIAIVILIVAFALLFVYLRKARQINVRIGG